MSNPDEPVWERIAGALYQIAGTGDPENDWLSAPAYLWDGEKGRSVHELNALPLNRLHGIGAQKVALRDNCLAMAKGAAAHDMMLWGARGMGKSALVRSVVSDVQCEYPEAISLIQVTNGAIEALPDLILDLADQPRAFILFCDDLTFDERDTRANLALRSLLDGGVIPRPAHIRFAVTSNRRALMKQSESDEPISLHARDERDNFLALVDRFGLNLGFHPCDQETYLEIVESYLKPLNLEYDRAKALAWAIARGNRSGRTAYQFAVEIASRAGVALDL
ncbi:DUF815 domain-containing protein [Erythrobacter sp. YT30]|uniref:DUF815 domain-containing protein n=1 Tax=Erythrobacter sp. YT30 TaxID=1735012 RepID=UPI00076D367A|nr:DUF815 domain-containing protein [Erythrobacter sp. YT30]KWV91402.1 ATPase [Erythrobacter sp. YT30]